jgi:hypothetical protein
MLYDLIVFRRRASWQWNCGTISRSISFSFESMSRMQRTKLWSQWKQNLSFCNENNVKDAKNKTLIAMKTKPFVLWRNFFVLLRKHKTIHLRMWENLNYDFVKKRNISIREENKTFCFFWRWEKMTIILSDNDRNIT